MIIFMMSNKRAYYINTIITNRELAKISAYHFHAFFIILLGSQNISLEQEYWMYIITSLNELVFKRQGQRSLKLIHFGH